MNNLAKGDLPKPPEVKLDPIGTLTKCLDHVQDALKSEIYQEIAAHHFKEERYLQSFQSGEESLKINPKNLSCLYLTGVSAYHCGVIPRAKWAFAAYLAIEEHDDVSKWLSLVKQDEEKATKAQEEEIKSTEDDTKSQGTVDSIANTSFTT